VPLGPSRTSITTFSEALADHGVYVVRETLRLIRQGEYRGIRILERLRTAQLLETGNASAKDQLYLAVAESGLAVRHHQQPPIHPHKWAR
jgi:hypothetical protein